MLLDDGMEGEEEIDTWQPLSLVTRRLLLRFQRHDGDFVLRDSTKNPPQDKQNVDIDPDQQSDLLSCCHIRLP
jgi:hypothetical protein